METTKIKIKIGLNEFEAEGPAETVQQQFETFKQLIMSTTQQMATPKNTVSPQAQQTTPVNGGTPNSPLNKIMHVSGRVVSLTALPLSAEDAALLIVLGHKELRGNSSVTGQEIGDGLDQSGRPVPRVDRIMEKAISEAHVLKTGIKRSTRYRLTNQGLAKAAAIANDLMATLP